MSIMSRLGLALGTAAMAVLLAGPARAHAVWIAERIEKPTVVYGHGASDEAYDPGKITRVLAIAEDGTTAEAKVLRGEANATLSLPDGTAAVVLEFDNGYWTKRADGSWVNEPRSKVPDAVEAGRYVKHHVAVLRGDVSLPSLPAQPLQIVPLENPLTKKAGDALPVRVLLDGAPLAGAELIVDYINLDTLRAAPTDDDGRTTVPIRNQGLNVIALNHSVPTPGDPDGDETGHTATLAFTLGHGPE